MFKPGVRVYIKEVKDYTETKINSSWDRADQYWLQFVNFPSDLREVMCRHGVIVRSFNGMDTGFEHNHNISAPIVIKFDGLPSDSPWNNTPFFTDMVEIEMDKNYPEYISFRNYSEDEINSIKRSYRIFNDNIAERACETRYSNDIKAKEAIEDRTCGEYVIKKILNGDIDYGYECAKICGSDNWDSFYSRYCYYERYLTYRAISPKW